MPNVPEACQSLAAEVAALEQADATLRSELATLVGSSAWAVLAKLGQGRRLLERKRRELDVCVVDHTAALQANLVVIDLSGVPGEPNVGRVAYLWDAAQPIAPQDTSVVNNHVIGFANQIPASLSISVATTGEADVHGPDFRSSVIDANDISSPLRIEVIVAPEMSIYQEDISTWWASFSSPPIVVEAPGAGAKATASVTSVEAKLVALGLAVRATGQLTFFSMGALLESTSFSASATVRIVPTATPNQSRLCDALVLDDMQLHSNGYADNLSSMLLPLVKNSLRESLSAQLGALISSELHWSISTAFAMAGFPQGVTLSLRRVSIDATAIKVQAAFGAIGTTLSTFVPPQMSPP